MGVDLIVRSPQGERVVTLDTRLIVGRGPECEVSIPSTRLSRQHAEFTLGRDGVMVRDLESRNGVLVNGARVESAVLQATDRVVLGDVAIMMRAAAAAAAPAARAVRPSAAANATMIVPTPSAPVPAAAGAEAPRPAAARTSVGLFTRIGFGPRAMMASALAALAAFVATAVPIVQTAAAQGGRAASIHAASLARLLAADNAAALATGQTLAATVRTMQAEPGVRGAAVMTPQGRILAPPDRINQSMSTIPALGDVASLRGLQVAVHDGQYDAAAVVEGGGRPLGVVWVSYDPSYAGLGWSTLGLSLGASLLMAVAAAVLASLFIQRMVGRRLDAFAVDVDLALRGQAPPLDDVHGLPALARPIESVNYAIARSRERDAVNTAAMPRPSPPPAPIARPAPAAALPTGAPKPAPAAAVATAPRPAAAAGPGVLVVDPAFLVANVDEAAARLLGARADALVGRHVLEAIADQTLVAALLDCMNELDTAKESTRTAGGADGRAIELRATRDGSTGPITFALRQA